MTIWNAQQLGLESGKTGRTGFLKMYEPAHDKKCEILEGAGPEEKAAKLVARLKETKVI